MNVRTLLAVLAAVAILAPSVAQAGSSRSKHDVHDQHQLFWREDDLQNPMSRCSLGAHCRP
jgi:hypothetical protein